MVTLIKEIGKAWIGVNSGELVLVSALEEAIVWNMIKGREGLQTKVAPSPQGVGLRHTYTYSDYEVELVVIKMMEK